MFKRVRVWFLTTVLTLIASVGGIASNWLTTDLQNALEPYRLWVWGAFVLSLLVTVILAIRERQAARDADNLTSGDFITGDKIQGDKVVGNAIHADVTESEAVIIGDGNVLTQIQTAVIHLTQEIQLATLRADQVQSVTTAYLEGLVTRYRYLDFRGMGVSDRVALQLPLLEMFVPLRARRELPAGETTARTLRLAVRKVTAEEAAEMGERLSEPIDVLQRLKAHNGVIVLGDPGVGKTTLPIRDLLAAFLAQGRTLLLMDGLDEVQSLAQRTTLVKRLEAFFALPALKIMKISTAMHTKSAKGRLSFFFALFAALVVEIFRSGHMP